MQTFQVHLFSRTELQTKQLVKGLFCATGCHMCSDWQQIYAFHGTRKVQFLKTGLCFFENSRFQFILTVFPIILGAKIDSTSIEYLFSQAMLSRKNLDACTYVLFNGCCTVFRPSSFYELVVLGFESLQQ